MIQKMYSIRDSKGEIFHPPFFQKTHGEAERTFHKLTNDDKSSMFLYPEDYDLYYIGEYDDNTGKLESLDTPHHIQKAVSLKSKPSLG